MKNHLITICARGGSKGVPDKNIKPLHGKSLIGYTIESAFQIQSVFDADIALSTDSEKILEVAKGFGLKEDYMRPRELAEDQTGKIDAISHVLQHYENKNYKRYQFIWDLDVSSPLRNLDDLLRAFEILQMNPEALNIFSVSHAEKNPYFNMVEKNSNGFSTLVKNRSLFKSRQVSPKVYQMNASFYLYRREFFDMNLKTATTERSLSYLIPHICFDIDEPLDFKIMEFLFRENLLDFEL